MVKPQKASTRLYCLIANKVRRAVVIRRGPSNHVRLITWNLKKDTFEYGQWFKGRIYERRCGISPDGSYFIYFAANHKQPLQSWTAISRPPWLKALALWPKGDCWNGGGYFIDDYSIVLNHAKVQAQPHPDFIGGCRKFKVASHAAYRGEDSPLYEDGLHKNGWKFSRTGQWEESAGFVIRAKIPEQWSKKSPKSTLSLIMINLSIGKRNAPWYEVDYRVQTRSGDTILELPATDWADWDTNGDLLFARNGCLLRARRKKTLLSEPVAVADFAGQKFEAIMAPY